MQPDSTASGRKVVFAWSRATPPLFMGGAEKSQQLLAQDLVRQGNTVTYVGSYAHPREGATNWYEPFLQALQRSEEVIHLSARAGVIEYQFRGISCSMYGSDELIEAVDSILKSESPEVLISAQERSDQVLSLGGAAQLLTVAWLHSVTPTGMRAVFGNPERILATSRFVRDRALQEYGVKADVFYPPFESVPLSYPGECVTLVNPIREKGVETFLALAKAFPDQQFIAVEGWYPVSLPQSLPNLSYLPKQFDMEPVWQQTKVLLAPSTIEEGFGRVVVEAGLHGIPSIASATSGLEEALTLIGGGSLVNGFAERSWIAALEQLLKHPASYEEESRRAREGSLKFVRNTVAEMHELGIL